MKVNVVVKDTKLEPNPTVMWLVATLIGIANSLLSEAATADPNIRVIRFEVEEEVPVVDIDLTGGNNERTN